MDFGTTNTGVAYAFSNNPDPDRIQIVTSWPSVGRGGINETKEKVPSEISYETRPATWGYMFKAGEPRLAWFKLLLDPAAGDKKYNDETVDPGNPEAIMTLPTGKTVVDVCADYLAIVYSHTMEALAKRMPNTLKTTPIKFVITTPAMWGVNAQHMTALAATKAGFGSRSIDWIDMVSEPEAAAAYALKQLNAENRHAVEGWEKADALTDEKAGKWSEGDSDSRSEGSLTDRCVELSLYDQQELPTWRPHTQLIVCDAGGGTVDLVAYEVTQMVPYLKVKETVQAKGGLCGATALDREFFRVIRARLGPHQEHLLTSKRTGRGSVMMAAWETAKRHFSRFSTSNVYIEHNMWDIEENEEAGITDEEFVFIR